jgi:hypothetical protein
MCAAIVDHALQFRSPITKPLRCPLFARRGRLWIRYVEQALFNVFGCFLRCLGIAQLSPRACVGRIDVTTVITPSHNVLSIYSVLTVGAGEDVVRIAVKKPMTKRKLKAWA